MRRLQIIMVVMLVTLVGLLMSRSTHQLQATKAKKKCIPMYGGC